MADPRIIEQSFFEHGLRPGRRHPNGFHAHVLRDELLIRVVLLLCVTAAVLALVDL